VQINKQLQLTRNEGDLTTIKCFKGIKARNLRRGSDYKETWYRRGIAVELD